MKYIIAALFTLVAIGCGFVVVELIRLNKHDLPNTPSFLKQTGEESVEKSASVFFQPETVTIASTSPTTVDIMLTSNREEVSKAQIELKYNPLLIRNVSLTLPQQSFFGTVENYHVLFNEVDQQFGRASFAIEIPDQGVPKRGTGVAVQISFTPVLYPGQKTQITFTPTTYVSSQLNRENLLQETVPLYVVRTAPLPRQATQSAPLIQP